MASSPRQSREVLDQYSKCGLAILLTLSLSSCFVVPFPTTIAPLPFPEKEMSQIVPGVTSRQKVVDLLGEPDFASPGASLVLYGDDRRVAGVFVIAPQQAVGASLIKTGHLVVLGYDESELVREVDLFRKGLFRNHSQVCTVSGVCIKPRISNTDGAFRILDAKFYDTPQSDADAKSFDVPTDRCAAYVYLDTSFWAGNTVLVHSDDDPTHKARLDESSYILWLHDSGSLNIVASDQLHSGKPVPPGKQVESNIEFDCQAEQAYVIKTTLRWDWGEGKHSLKLSLETPNEASVALRKRRLIFDG